MLNFEISNSAMSVDLTIESNGSLISSRRTRRILFCAKSDGRHDE